MRTTGKATDLITFSRSSGGTYLDSDGVLKTASADIPRIEYDANGNVLGLLVEESRTNLLTYSGDFTDASWIKGTMAVVSNATTAPDGSNTAELIYPAVSGNYRHVRVNAYSPWSGLYTCSFYAKYAGIRYAVIVDSDGSGAGVGFDIQSGTYTILGAAASDGTTASITDIGDGWYRCSYTSTNGYLYINLCDSISGVSVTADGTSGIYIWGAQLEAGAFPTSYIPTSGSTATRSADVASIPVADFGYRQSEGTVVVETTPKAISSKNIFNLNVSGLDSESIYGNADASGHLIVRDTTTQVNLDAGSFVQNQASKLVVAIKADDFAACLNGGTVVTDSAGTIPTPITNMRIGTTAPQSSVYSGHIKSIRYYPRRLTDAQLQELTQ